MNFNFITNLQSCSDLIKNYVPVNLVLYSHIPSMIVALAVGIFVLSKNKGILGKILFSICVSFSFWTLFSLGTWLNVNSINIMFVWSFFGLLTGLVSILSFYFFYVFTLKKDLTVIQKIITFAPLLPILFITPTVLNLINFKIDSCEATENILFNYYYYGLGFVAILGILLLFVFNLNKIEKIFRQQVVLMWTGLTLFLFTFLSISYISSYFDNYNFEFYGLYGMVIFMGFIAYLIVKFKEFDIKLLATQALVWALVILIGSQFLFVQNPVNRVLTAITLIIAGSLGLTIIRSVKKEVALREQLQVANEGQTNLIHIMNHQIKGYLSIDKNIFAELLTEDYGKIPASAVEIVSKGLENSDKGTKYVTDILKGASAENGTLAYDMKNIDFKEIVSDKIESLKDVIEKKKLKLTIKLSDGDYKMIGDKSQLSEAVRNLIENSLYYTIKGSIIIALKREANKIIFSVKDTGVGVRAEDKDIIFKAGGAAKDAAKINVNSSGYGLAFVKGVVEKHKGKIWFESEGHNKGSTFFVELPTK
jgi:signal transduction histidine kinase